MFCYLNKQCISCPKILLLSNYKTKKELKNTTEITL